jgi:alanine-glyoxylate transaminase / serine-glyoxylate transaminase / serine-pyruvate transaminase
MAAIPYRRLFGPGPCNAYPEALMALQQPLLGHLDPAFIAMTDRVCDGLRMVWQTQNRYTLAMSGTGMSGMEAAFANVVTPGDVVVVGVNGFFAERQVDLAQRMGAEVIRVDFPWGQPIDPEAVATAHPNPTVIAAVHAETSTGVRSDIAALGALKGEALLLVDAVTSLGGIEVAVDAWGVDIAYSGTQKCLGTPPGLAPFTMSERAYQRRNPRPHSFYLDISLMGAYVGATQGPARAYHHTASSVMYAALDATLARLATEGLENVWARHQAAGDRFQAGLQDMGLELFAADGYRLPELTTIKAPEGVDSARVRAFLLSEYDIEIGAGVKDLASTVWRVGLMGANATTASVTLLLGALQDALQRA